MEAAYRHEGRAVDYTPSGAAVAAGQVIDLGSGLVGIARLDIADGQLGALAVEGVFDVIKAAGSGVTFARGATVGWDDVNNTAVASGDVNKTFDLGKAVVAAADADSKVRVKINI